MSRAALVVNSSLSKGSVALHVARAKLIVNLHLSREREREYCTRPRADLVNLRLSRERKYCTRSRADLVILHVSREREKVLYSIARCLCCRLSRGLLYSIVRALSLLFSSKTSSSDNSFLWDSCVLRVPDDFVLVSLEAFSPENSFLRDFCVLRFPDDFRVGFAQDVFSRRHPSAEPCAILAF